MKNVKDFLQGLVKEIDNQSRSCTTHWTEEQFEDITQIAEDLQKAIEKDLV